MPLHCVFCKKIFKELTTIESKCAAKIEPFQNNNYVTPQRDEFTSDVNCNSPPIITTFDKNITISCNKYTKRTDQIIYLTTSTPMRTFDEVTGEVISLTENSEKNSDKLFSQYKEISSLNEAEVSDRSNGDHKKKVTFVELNSIEEENEGFNEKQICEY